MGLVSVFKGIGKGVGKGFVQVGKGIAAGVDAVDDALDHPAADPTMAALSVFVPAAWVSYGVKVVKSVKATADSVRDVPLSDEDKRRLFVAKFREEYPEASDGDLATLACVLTKLEKSPESQGATAN